MNFWKRQYKITNKEGRWHFELRDGVSSYDGPGFDSKEEARNAAEWARREAYRLRELSRSLRT